MATDRADDADVGEGDGDGMGRDTEGAAPPDDAPPDDAPASPRVAKGAYDWEAFKREYYYDANGDPPTDAEGEAVPFEPADYLGFDPADLPGLLARGGDAAAETDALVDRRTVDVSPDVEEDAFFTDVYGNTTMANRYDLEKAVAMPKKTHFSEVERYWVNKPYALVVLFHSDKENEMKYYLVEPYRNRVEESLDEFLSGKLRTAIKYTDDDVATADTLDDRRDVIERETRRLLSRYEVYDGDVRGEPSVVDRLQALLGRMAGAKETETDEESPGELDGLRARPEPAVLAEDARTLTQYQVEKLLYYLQRDFVGYERIDGIKHDVNIEDISCDGYESPVFVYHSEHEQLITNVRHGTERLDDFVVKLAQRSGKGISKRQPQVDATLPDGSRAQLTLGREVSDHGTNYTIRQFKDVPFTPIDLINWKTFSLDEMAYLWLAIENDKSAIFAGGTASGKTTSLNAVSLFIPANTKIVSIEDTREVELPQRNWVASVTRPSFGDDEAGDIDEFDLLETTLRQRPDYIVMGEVRGEEGRTLFQVMSTGHTTYTTFHADNVGEVLKRFTTEPINVSKTLFTALDLVSVQSATRVRGRKVRRNRNITEINRYDAENDEINVSDVFEWEPVDDEFRQLTDSNTLDQIQFDRGWSRAELERELDERRVVLAYLIRNDLNTYAEVAATVQAYIADPDTILTLMANDALEESLADLRGMESVLIDVDPETEAMVPRPEPAADVYAEAGELLERAEEEVFAEYRGADAPDISFALTLDADETEPGTDADETEPVDGDSPGERSGRYAGDADENRPTGNTDANRQAGDADDRLDDLFDDVDEVGGDGAAEADGGRHDTADAPTDRTPDESGASDGGDAADDDADSMADDADGSER